VPDCISLLPLLINTEPDTWEAEDPVVILIAPVLPPPAIVDRESCADDLTLTVADPIGTDKVSAPSRADAPEDIKIEPP